MVKRAEEEALSEAEPRRGEFRAGDLALLIDRKRRRYLVRLEPDGAFHTHMGILPHADLIGREAGCRVSIAGHRILALRPTLSDYILESPRVTQVIYPKDLGAILVYGDIYPGARVLEAGLGSGALTTALLRAVGPSGNVVSYETRTEQVARALENIRVAIGETPNHDVRSADVYESIVDRELDRVVLDVPEPWRAVDHAAEALSPGGILLCFLPTVLQVHRLSEELDDHPRFDLVETIEVMVRPWHFSRRSARPQHRMVAHTGFITTARLCAADTPPPSAGGRAALVDAVAPGTTVEAGGDEGDTPSAQEAP